MTNEELDLVIDSIVDDFSNLSNDPGLRKKYQAAIQSLTLDSYVDFLENFPAVLIRCKGNKTDLTGGSE